MHDYLVVGSGLYGAIFAHEAKAHGKSVLIVDKRSNIAGNIYTEKIENINVHKYGAHIFHLLFWPRTVRARFQLVPEMLVQASSIDDRTPDNLVRNKRHDGKSHHRKENIRGRYFLG